MNRDNKGAGPSIESLKYSNPSLFHQIKKNAEDHIHSVIDAEMQSIADSMRSGGGAGVMGGVRGMSVSVPGGGTSSLTVNPLTEVKGFIGESLVILNLQRAEYLRSQLKRHIGEQEHNHDSISGGDTTGLKKTHARLHSMLEGINIPPPLPPMVFGLLPLEPSKEFKALAAVQGKLKDSKLLNQDQSIKRTNAVFQVDNLERDRGLKDAALKVLFGVRPFVSRQVKFTASNVFY